MGEPGASPGRVTMSVTPSATLVEFVGEFDESNVHDIAAQVLPGHGIRSSSTCRA